MFTGLIEAICRLTSVRRSGSAAQLGVDLGAIADGVNVGDSIAINGVCLTVASLDGRVAAFEVSSETLAKSTLGKQACGSMVNIEQAMKAGERFGGHFVQGHIDGVAIITAIDRQGEFAEIKFSAEAELLDGVVPKGSVAVDGISLTIAELGEKGFSCAVIPKTLEATTLGRAKIGDEVNIETDIITRTIKNQLEKLLPKENKLSVEKLKELGF